MTGYVCLLDRSGADVDSLLLRRLAEPLETNGAAPFEACRGPAGLVIRRPGRDDMPLANDPESGVIAGLTGRMSAVGEGSGTDGFGGGLAEPISPPQALAAFLQKGIDFLAGTAGSFIFMLADPREVSLTIARDHLGGCKLYYYLDRRWLIAASEPSAILRHAAVAGDLDEGSAARFLGFRFSETTASFFSRIKELPAAHWLRVDPTEARVEQYWRFKKLRVSHGDSTERLNAGFLAHLGQSVTNQISGTDPDRVAVSLSGGLDSTAVAALTPRETRLCSWYFENIPACDERRSINEVAEYLQRRVHWTAGDGFYPLSGAYIDRFVHANSPHFNAFASLKQELYNTAIEAGCERMLVGDAGDVLYAAQDYWLRDILVGRQAGALNSLVTTVRKAAHGDSFARLALRRLLPVRHIRATFRRRRPPWLTDAAHAALPGDRLSPILPSGGLKYRFDPGVGAKHIELESEERSLFAQCGIERGNPFWHWPLLEFVLNLPAWWFHRDGRTKVLTREAMRGLLPDQVRNSRRIGLLGPFFLRGIDANRAAIRDTVFKNPRSDWQRYVNRSWVEPYLSATDSIAFGHTILWRVISYELWYRRLIQ